MVLLLQELCVPIEDVRGRPWLRSASTGALFDRVAIYKCSDLLTYLPSKSVATAKSIVRHS